MKENKEVTKRKVPTTGLISQRVFCLGQTVRYVKRLFGIHERPLTPSESLEQSLRELKAMRQDKNGRKTWQELKKELDEDS